jgi:hypothetical protein
LRQTAENPRCVFVARAGFAAQIVKLVAAELLFAASAADDTRRLSCDCRVRWAIIRRREIETLPPR